MLENKIEIEISQQIRSRSMDDGKKFLVGNNVLWQYLLGIVGSHWAKTIPVENSFGISVYRN